jgi:hypothetical protein
MDRKTGRPIISLKFKAPPADAAAPAGKPAELTRKPQISGRDPFGVPKIASRRGVREVVVTRPAPPSPPPPRLPEKVVEESKPVPIPPTAFKAATKAATQAVTAVLADPTWQSAELQRSYQDAKPLALPVHRKQAKLISGIVLKRVAPDLEEGETKTLAMRAAYAAAFSILIGGAGEPAA